MGVGVRTGDCSSVPVHLLVHPYDAGTGAESRRHFHGAIIGVPRIGGEQELQGQIDGAVEVDFPVWHEGDGGMAFSDGGGDGAAFVEAGDLAWDGGGGCDGGYVIKKYDEEDGDGGVAHNRGCGNGNGRKNCIVDLNEMWVHGIRGMMYVQQKEIQARCWQGVSRCLLELHWQLSLMVRTGDLATCSAFAKQFPPSNFKFIAGTENNGNYVLLAVPATRLAIVVAQKDEATALQKVDRSGREMLSWTLLPSVLSLNLSQIEITFL